MKLCSITTMLFFICVITMLFFEVYGLKRIQKGRFSTISRYAQTNKKNAFYSKDDVVSKGVSSSTDTPSSIPFINDITTNINDNTNNIIIKKETNIELDIVKIRLGEEVEKEEQRALQLETLLDAFKSALDEKDQLVVIELEILSQMNDVIKKISDLSMINELEISKNVKNNLIEIERNICDAIRSITDSLALEISQTRMKITELQKVVLSFPNDSTAESLLLDYQLQLKSSLQVRYILLFIHIYIYMCI